MSAAGSSGPEVRVTTGRLRGRMEDGVAVFRGVPFAQPPVGSMRLAAPVPAEPWDGVREAAEFGPPPPQSTMMGLATQIGEEAGANWLTANVWSPDLGAADLPVMVWIHGGGYMYGWSGEPTFDGGLLTRHGVVVVTFNYRVAAEGFGHFEGAPANRGLLDQVAALSWVRDNIAAFGGDPGRVTVFGESAGAGSIAALMAMPRAVGLFRRAIAQSVPAPFFTTELASDIARTVAGELGLPPVAGELARLAPQRLIDAGDAVAAKMNGMPHWGRAASAGTLFGPVVDGAVLPSVPWRALAGGAATDVELIVGHTRDEYRLFTFLNGDTGQITAERAATALRMFAPDPAAYRAAHPGADAERLYELVYSDWLFRMPSLHLAQAHHAGGGRVHLYELSWTAPGMEDVLGACHGLDVPLTFGNLTAGAHGMWFGPEPPAQATELSSRIRTAWAAFAATGDPGWPAYEPEGRSTWILDATPRVAAYPEDTSRRLWSGHTFDPLPLGAR
ncbi:carboxylesterase family protein [Planotetraspora phitsanulokensis]|uniref:Carboxylic ester hydrolase n=1 Tax=Planotetraspora phitsanulokensis TaxID=575192 RepID=A0A8J3U7E1_9ACTN|nr:carboxylesterase family protein [Planotetraspora phitsanulokensis]GII39610.1 carboxylic ester hydrolase [Planotetraspora phitsanulokensis]